jgi:hypothetical protein
MSARIWTVRFLAAVGVILPMISAISVTDPKRAFVRRRVARVRAQLLAGLQPHRDAEALRNRRTFSSWVLELAAASLRDARSMDFSEI